MTSIFEHLKYFGITSSQEDIIDLLGEIKIKNLSFSESCGLLWALEKNTRDHKNMASRLKKASMGKFKSIEQFDWNYPKKIDQDLYSHLITLDFIKQHQNILFRGASGLGKTTLAQNIGLAAVKQGYKVRFESLSRMLADILRQDSLPRMERRIKFFSSFDLLIVDELGYIVYDSASADVFFNLISQRHEKKSTIVTTNLSFKDWGTCFQSTSCLTALVDRFSQHAHIMDIEGEKSWRHSNRIARNLIYQLPPVK